MTQIRDKQFAWLVAGAVCLLACVGYWNSFSGEFVWDDASSVLLHEHVQDPKMFFQLFREDQHPFGRGQGNFYRPLVAASFMLDYQLANPDDPMTTSPLIFHLTNTAWHIASALLLFGILTRLGAPRFVRAAAPLIYVIHPLHTEAVTYISGRADPMSAAFMFAAILLALWDGSRGKRIAGAVLCAVCFWFGLLCKESAFMLPGLLLLFALFVPRRKEAADGESQESPAYARPWAALLATSVLLGVYAVLRGTVLYFPTDTVPRDLSFGERLVEVGQAFAIYIRLLFIPAGLHMEWSLEGVPAWYAGVGAVLLAACVAVVAVSWLTGQRRIALGMAWFLVTWFPISGVFPLNAPMAEHWLYVPMAGFVWAFMEALWLAIGRSRLRYGAVAAVYAGCACFTALTVHRNLDWHDNESLYRATLAKNPKSIRIHYNLAVTYEYLVNNPAGARRHYEQVLDLYDQRAQEQPASEDGKRVYYDDELEAHLSLGRLYAAEGRYDLAGTHYSTLLRVEGGDDKRALRAQAALGLGQCFMAFGDQKRAQEFFRQAVELDPSLRESMGGPKPSA